MKSLLILLMLFTSSLTTLDDDSIKYVSIATVHLPNEVCNAGWAIMVNSSSKPGGPNRNIRVYYTHNNQSRVCETRPVSKIPDPNEKYTLLGCVGGDYKIIKSEYME